MNFINLRTDKALITPEATITTEEAYQKDNLFLVNKGLKGNV